MTLRVDRRSAFRPHDSDYTVVRLPLQRQTYVVGIYSAEPSCNIRRVLNERGQKKKLRPLTLAIDCCEQQFKFESSASLHVVGFIYYYEGQRAVHSRLPPLPQHQVKFFGCGDKNAKLLFGITYVQQLDLNIVNFQRRAHLLDHNLQWSEISSKLPGHLVNKRPGRNEIGHPPTLVLKLVQCL